MEQQFSEDKVKQVFNSFCEDGSGLLNLEQIQKVNKDIEINISNYDMKKVFKKLDQNKDQKISFGEYYLWVIHGRQNKQEAILFTRNSFLKVLDKAAKQINKIGDLSLGDQDDLSEHEIISNVGDAPPKSFFGVRTFIGNEALAFSKEHTEKFNDIKEGTPAIILKIATDQPEKAEEEFMTLFEELMALGESLLPEEHVPLLENIKIDYATQGSNHLLIGVTMVHELFTEVLEQLESLVLQNIPENLVTSVKLQVSTGINFKDLIENIDKSIQDSIGQTGLSISLDANIKQSILEKATTQVCEVLQKKEEKDGGIQSDKLKILQRLLPLFLIRGSKVNLNFKTLDKLFETSELPGQEMIEISGQELIDQIVELAGGNVQEMIEELPVGESILQVFQEYCKADAQLSIQIPRGVVQAYVSTEGVKEIVEKLLNP